MKQRLGLASKATQTMGRPRDEPRTTAYALDPVIADAQDKQAGMATQHLAQHHAKFWKDSESSLRIQLPICLSKLQKPP